MKAGRILMSFNFFDTQNIDIPKEINLPREKYKVKLRILGLRDLKSLGLLAVKKAFIKFDINSIRAKEEKQELDEKKEINTQPKDSGSSPNICAIMEFELSLPIDINLCPFLSCTVKDHLLGGLYEPVLGQFSINLPFFIKKTKKIMDEKIKKAEIKYSPAKPTGGKIEESVVINKPKLHEEIKIPPDEKFINLEMVPPEKMHKKPIFNKNDKKDKNIQGYSKFEDEEDIEAKLPSKKNEKKQGKIEKIEKTEEKIIKKDEKNKDDKKPEETKKDPQPSKKLEKNDEKQSLLKMKKTNGKETPLLKSIANEQLKKPRKKVIDEKNNINSEYIVIPAKYKLEKDKHIEIEIPPPENYLPLSYDTKETKASGNIKKHYRYFVNDPLEQTPFMGEPTFDEMDIIRGKREDSSSFFDQFLGSDNNPKPVGKFKGWINVMRVEDQISYSALKKKNPNKFDDRDSEFLKSVPILVRVYILDLTGLAQMDTDSLSDPYIKIKLGEKVVDKMLQIIKGSLPGCSNLHVQVWDNDPLINDDLIGETIIDLENRYFSNKWKKMKYYPIETRQIFSPLSSISRGTVRLWVEIIPLNHLEKMNQIWEISPKPPAEFEMRVIVWDIEDCPKADDDIADYYVTGAFHEKRQETDTHFRSSNGKGSYNWRMIYPLTLSNKTEDPSITFQVWDKDILSANDFLAEATFSFEDLAKEAFENDCVIKMDNKNAPMTEQMKEAVSQKFKDFGNEIQDAFSNKNTTEVSKKKNKEPVEKFTITLRNVEKEGYTVQKAEGKITLSLELLPKEMAEKNKAGNGRNEPNQNPWLPPPVGRMSLSLNPFSMLGKLLGPSVRNKLLCFCCCFICCGFLIAMIPFTFSNVFGNIITKIII